MGPSLAVMGAKAGLDYALSSHWDLRPCKSPRELPSIVYIPADEAASPKTTA